MKPLLVSCALLAACGSAAAGQVDATVRPVQYVRGGAAQEMRINGRGLAITGVEVQPADGITFGPMTVRDATREDGFFEPAGIKVWVVPVTVDKSALPGDRKVYVRTAKGRSDGLPIQVVTHMPALSALEIVAARPDGTEFTIVALDEEGDLAEGKVSLLGSYDCAGRYSVSRVTVSKMVARGQTLEIHGHAPLFGQALRGRCTFAVTLTDGSDISSNSVSKVVVYK